MATLESILLVNNYIILSRRKAKCHVIRKYLTRKISDILKVKSDRRAL